MSPDKGLAFIQQKRNEIQKRINSLRGPRWSKGTYSFPLLREGISQPFVTQNSFIREGQPEYAIYIPAEQDETILAPASGIIVEVVTHNKIWGRNPKYDDNSNYVIVQTGPNEYYGLGHIKPIDQLSLYEGMPVTQGDPIAKVDKNGYVPSKGKDQQIEDCIRLVFWVEHRDYTKESPESLLIRWEDDVRPIYTLTH